MDSRTELLRAEIVEEEGEEEEAYKDSEGLWTVGIGHLLDDDQSPEELAILGLDDELDDWEGFKINKEQMDKLFDLDVQTAIDDLSPSFVPEDLAHLNDVRYAVIVSMSFQMGGPRVRKFKNFIKAVKRQDWERASLEMVYANPDTKRRSRWYTQTPDRCQRAADAMRTGSFGGETELPSVDETPEGPLSTYPSKELLQELLHREDA